MERNSPEMTPVRRLSVYLAAVAAAVVLALLGYLVAVENLSVFQSRQEPGAQVLTDVTVTETPRADTPLGVVKVRQFTLDPGLDRDCHLAFYVVHHYVAVYLDGELVYALTPSPENGLGKTLGSNWVMLPIDREDAGKTVVVELTPVYESFRNWETQFWLGSELSIYLHRLRSDLPQLLLAVIAVFAGQVFLCVSVYNLFMGQPSSGLGSLGLFSMMMGLWRLTDTRFTPFLMKHRPVLLFNISIAMLLLGMIPLIGSMRERFSPASRKRLDVWCSITALVALVQLGLQITGIADLRETLLVTHVMIVLGVLVILGSVLYDRRCAHHTPQPRTGRKLPLICVVGVLADLVMFYIRGTSSGLIFSLLAFVLYVIFTGIVMMQEQAQREKLLKEQAIQLTESRIAMMLSQMQPHFLYNALNTIYYLCDKDPEAAREAISNFSDHLRNNIASLEQKEPIPFAEELEHIRTYLELEKARYGEELDVVYKIETTRFLIPTLTVQPLVENAVKHGISKKRGGGTLTIATRELPDRFEITVTDDGVGFDPAREPEDSRPHVGLRNVRERLETMGVGTLAVQSAPGQGTSVCLYIWKKEGESHEDHRRGR